MELVERGEELRRIEDFIERAVDGQGRVLVVEGEAGIGKTSVLDAAAAAAVSNDMRCLRSQGGELEQELPFAIARQLFDPVLRAGSPAFRAEILADAAGLAAPVLNAERVTETGTETTAAVVHGLYWVCSNLAEHAPLFIVVDDAHWIDESSLRFISHLVRRLADLRLLLVVATRPGRSAVNLSRALTGVKPEVLRLRPLSDAAIVALVQREFGPTTDPSFCAAFVEVTGGNPFLLTEAIIELRAAGAVPTRSAATQVRTMSSDAITRSVLARLARHGAAAQSVARAVAVLGPDAQMHRVAALSGIPSREAGAIVDALRGDSLLTGSTPIRFIHPLIRSAVYNDYAEVRGAADHKQIAHMLEAESAPLSRLVPHLLAAEAAGDPAMVEMLRAAADDAMGSGSPEVAVQCLQRALAEPVDPKSRGAVHTQLGRALALANRFAESEAALRSGLDCAADPVMRSEIALDLAWLVIALGRGSTTKEMLHEALAQLPEEAVQQRHRLQAMLASTAFMDFADPATWTAQVDPALLSAESHSAEERLLLAIAALGGAVSGHPDAELTGRLAAAALIGDAPPRERWMIATYAGPALVISDREVEAIEALTSALDAARADGDVATYRSLAVLRSNFWFCAGNMLEAEADARAPLELAFEEDMQDFRNLLWPLISVLVEQGRLAEVEGLLVDHGLDGALPSMDEYAIFTQFARGRLRMAQGRLDEALADLLAVGMTVTAGGFVNPGFLFWRSEVAAVYLAMERIADARELAEEEVELARSFGARRPIGVSLRTLGLVETGERRISMLTESAEILGSTTARLEHARTLVDLGIALRLSGYRDRALDCMRRGLDLATKCRADALVERARSGLVVAGARPRRSRTTGPTALTAGEHRVASLAVNGYSNREIAQRLFVSRRAVELHLTNTFRKLGIESRRDLGAALDSVD